MLNVSFSLVSVNRISYRALLHIMYSFGVLLVSLWLRQRFSLISDESILQIFSLLVLSSVGRIHDVKSCVEKVFDRQPVRSEAHLKELYH